MFYVPAASETWGAACGRVSAADTKRSACVPVARNSATPIALTDARGCGSVEGPLLELERSPFDCVLEAALHLLFIDFAVMLCLAGAMLMAARFYLRDRSVLRHMGQAILPARSEDAED